MTEREAWHRVLMTLSEPGWELVPSSGAWCLRRGACCPISAPSGSVAGIWDVTEEGRALRDDSQEPARSIVLAADDTPNANRRLRNVLLRVAGIR